MMTMAREILPAKVIKEAIMATLRIQMEKLLNQSLQRSKLYDCKVS
jgi:hypothetical protein